MNTEKREKLRISASAAISAGLVRDINQDSFYLNGTMMSQEQESSVGREIMNYDMEESGTGGLFGVFDGMGGEENGELASYIAAKSMSELRSDLDSPGSRSARQLISRYYYRTDREISAQAKRLGAECMGSTGVVLWTDGARVIASNLGDSRIYRLRGGELTMLSHDQTPSQELVDRGVYTQEEMDSYPRSSALSSFFGMSHIDRTLKAYIPRQFSLRSGDVFILCSDGLTDMLTFAQLKDTLSGCGSNARAIAASLVQAALDNGGEDNVTVVAVCAE